MADTIAKTMCTLGVWGAAASILIWADFSTPAPVELAVLFAAAFSTAAIWNYTLSSKTLRSQNATADPANEKKHDA
jgi:hypothetical protein